MEVNIEAASVGGTILNKLCDSTISEFLFLHHRLLVMQWSDFNSSTLAFWVHANLLGLFSVDMCLCAGFPCPWCMVAELDFSTATLAGYVNNK